MKPPSEQNTPLYSVELCRGSTSCPRALIEAQKEGITGPHIEALLDRLSGEAPHQAAGKRPFTISLSLCPNGCSRPQIADIGVIAVSYPTIDEEKCTACRACVTACREGAIIIDNKGRKDILSTCIGCGDCFDSCSDNALITDARKGFRLLLGGRLGRHPHLGEDTGKIYTPPQLLDSIEKIYTYWLNNRLPGERLRELINRTGLP